MKKTTLGLDLGPNSIGWALIEYDSDENPIRLADAGVRVFQEAVDAKTRVPKNTARRDARSARKRLARRKMRREALTNFLVKNGLLPQERAQRASLFTDPRLPDPYTLRRKGLDEPLSPFELGRAMYHLNQRRGFLSNRKTDRKKDSEQGKVLQAIAYLQKDIQDSGSRTLGEYLAIQPTQRRRYTHRGMYEQEFETLWDSQARYHPILQDPALKVAAYKIFFFQRPLKIQKNLVGRCTFEPGRKRAHRGTILAQRFRLTQLLNNLRIRNSKTYEWRTLRDEERKILRAELEITATLTWHRARKALGLHSGEVFNLEEDGKQKDLKGNHTVAVLGKILGTRWSRMTAEEHDALVTDLLTIEKEPVLMRRLAGHWGFDEATVEKLMKTQLEEGYARLSQRAIKRVLPHLEQGLRYDEACQAAGYHHSDLNRKQKKLPHLGLPPNLRNPVVQKALFEVRKVVNALIRTYGLPSVIRIEMARDMKQTRQERQDYQKRQKDQEGKRREVADLLRREFSEFSSNEPKRSDIEKYLLWEECGGFCPYTGDPIPPGMLFSGTVDVEHILPYSRSLDDSYMNKTLCVAHFNRETKRNQTPWEVFQGTPAAWDEVVKRVKVLPKPKRERFLKKEMEQLEDFVARQLNDTRYISTEVKDFLSQLGCGVEVSKGPLTAELRSRWSLDRILAVEGVLEKNRTDHRHHTVDAVVIALSNRSIFQKLSRLSGQYGWEVLKEDWGEGSDPKSSRLRNVRKVVEASVKEALESWPTFMEDIDARIRTIIVSHAINRKITGALHQETAYGYDEKEGVFVFRKPLSSLSPAEVGSTWEKSKVRDKAVWELLMDRIAANGGDMKKAFATKALEDAPLFHKDGKTPIRSVRLKTVMAEGSYHPVQEDRVKPYKYFAYGNNHHVEILEHVKTGKRKGVFVTAMEAARRARILKVPIVQKDHGSDWKFVMALSINDMVEVLEDGVKKSYRVQKMTTQGAGVITFRLHTAATLDDDATRLFKNPNSFEGLKILVDPIGRIVPAKD